MTAVLHHLRRNAIAYVALFVALGGTGYAAISFVNTSINEVRSVRSDLISPSSADWEDQ